MFSKQRYHKAVHFAANARLMLKQATYGSLLDTPGKDGRLEAQVRPAALCA
jgi:hypothetical protein